MTAHGHTAEEEEERKSLSSPGSKSHRPTPLWAYLIFSEPGFVPGPIQMQTERHDEQMQMRHG